LPFSFTELLLPTWAVSTAEPFSSFRFFVTLSFNDDAGLFFLGFSDSSLDELESGGGDFAGEVSFVVIGCDISTCGVRGASTVSATSFSSCVFVVREEIDRSFLGFARDDAGFLVFTFELVWIFGFTSGFDCSSEEDEDELEDEESDDLEVSLAAINPSTRYHLHRHEPYNQIQRMS
jgi:hypothetical protein